GLYLPSAAPSRAWILHPLHPACRIVSIFEDKRLPGRGLGALRHPAQGVIRIVGRAGSAIRDRTHRPFENRVVNVGHRWRPIAIAPEQRPVQRIVAEGGGYASRVSLA